MLADLWKYWRKLANTLTESWWTWLTSTEEWKAVKEVPKRVTSEAVVVATHKVTGVINLKVVEATAVVEDSPITVSEAKNPTEVHIIQDLEEIFERKWYYKNKNHSVLNIRDFWILSRFFV
jgi:hypothetical protein